MKRSLALITLSFAAATAFATTYVRVETDRPLPGGAPVEIQPVQTYAAPQASSTPAGPSREQQLLNDMGNPFHYDSCAVTPAADQTFTNPESVSLGVQLSPPLRPGDVLVLSLDGTPVGGRDATTFLVKPVARGSHTVAADVKDRYGRSACRSSSTFHVFQPGLNSPARQAPPRPRGR
jgi:hypothetical protein